MKNIVICCDGTGNEFGDHNTNVVLTYMAAVKSLGQITWYDPGVGTGGWEYNEGTGALKATSDQATGHGLQKNVMDAYRFLMEFYEEGDRIFLFGFSRGAFTTRSLAGMLYKCGLLERGYDNLTEYASKIYNTPSVSPAGPSFKQAFGRPCPVHFIGVWDTVQSLVMNAGKKFHDATLNPEVTYGFHALAIDERRADFVPCVWDERSVGRGQKVEQVWFAGVHSDVGGWYDERGLSNIALNWILGKAEACGMELDADASDFRGDFAGQLHESDGGFWRFRGSAPREIPQGASVHSSVNERIRREVLNYNPPNIRLPSDINWVA